MSRQSVKICLGVCLLSGLTLAAADPPPTNAPARNDLEAFKIVTERNIFNANRSARSGGRGDSPKQVQVDWFTLVGTLSYGKESFAFFDGSGSQYRRALKAGETYAGYRIVEIGPNAIKLTASDQEIELPVGTQMRREEGGPWKLSDKPTPSEDAAGSTEKPDSTAGGDASDVLKRLLQKREQELNK